MIPGLGRIIEKRGVLRVPGSLDDDLLEAHLSVFGPGNQLVGVFKIGFVMDPMVEVEGCTRYDRLEGLVRVRKGLQLETRRGLCESAREEQEGPSRGKS